MTTEHQQWLLAELDRFNRATPDERAVVLRDVEQLSKSQHPETADWNAALLAHLTAQNLPVQRSEKQAESTAQPTWGAVAETIVWGGKMVAPPAALLGGGYLAYVAIASGGAWIVANGWAAALVIGAGGLWFCASGLFGEKPKPGVDTRPAQQSESGTAHGGNVIIQNFTINGNGNTVVNKAQG